jgi:hypothetical protein
MRKQGLNAEDGHNDFRAVPEEEQRHREESTKQLRGNFLLF